MSEVASIIADLVRAGVDPALIGRVAAAFAENVQTVQNVQDEGAERRREIDRRRKHNNWPELRSAVFKRDGYVCVYCGIDVSAAPQCDHIIPISRGGPNEIDNLATSCRTCNSRKGFRTPDEWAVDQSRNRSGF